MCGSMTPEVSLCGMPAVAAPMLRDPLVINATFSVRFFAMRPLLRACVCWCRGSDAAAGSPRGIRSFHHLPCRHHAPTCAGTPLLPLLRGGSVMVLLRMTYPPG